MSRPSLAISEDAESPKAPTAAAPAPARSRKMRDWFLWLHRVTGFFLVVFLVVAGVTGTLIAFYHELDSALNPRLYHVAPPAPGVAMLDPFQLRERVAAHLPEENISEVPFKRKPGHAVEMWLPESGREAFVDPYDGRLLGTRKWGDLGEGLRLNLIPFIYRFHYTLGLKEVGSWLFGIAALLWTIDCFVGAYLTFPPAQKRKADGQPSNGWLRRWAPAWLMKTGQLFSTIFTFHRAAGLWLWAMLLVFAWSGVGFNLRPVFNPVMKVFGHQAWVDLPELEPPPEKPALAWPAAHARGRELMASEARKRGFTVGEEYSLGYEAHHGTWSYRAHTSLDVSRVRPRTSVEFDDSTGQLRAFYAPTGQTAANSVESWIFALHMATVGGLPYRIFVAVLGLVIPVLAVSGIWIWWRKRRKTRVGNPQ